MVLPMEKLPELAFLLMIMIFFIALDYILTLVTVFSIYTHLPHLILALTLISWASSTLELFNLCIGISDPSLFQLSMTSLLSSLIFTFYILIPVASLFKMS